MKRFLLLVPFVILSSCVSHNSLIYLQDKAGIGPVVPINPVEYQVKKGDLLQLRVHSLDPNVELTFNGSLSAISSGVANARSSFYLLGNSVNGEGKIVLPVIGEVEVSGRTIEETRKLIQDKLDVYFVNATASVKLLNQNFTILGEVTRPGTYDMFSDKFSVLDALGLAGDMTDYGNRKVRIWRRGETEILSHTIDLTSRDVISSEWFFLQPGDFIYVEPVKQKRTGFGTFPFGVVFQSITTAVTLFYFFKAVTSSSN